MSRYMHEYDLDSLSFEVKEKNARILTDGFDEYAFLLKFPPLSLSKNIETTEEFIKDVRETFYELSADFNFDDNFKPWKKIERKYADELKEARRYRDDSNGKIGTAVKMYEIEIPKEKLSMFDAIGGHLAL